MDKWTQDKAISYDFPERSEFCHFQQSLEFDNGKYEKFVRDNYLVWRAKLGTNKVIICLLPTEQIK